MKLRKLTDKGLSEFSHYIQNLRKRQDLQTPKYLLDSEEHSEKVELDLDVTEEAFSSRYEMGAYLAQLFSEKNIQSYIGHAGFWSWFALLWFEQLCPVNDGKRKPRKEYHYILSAEHRYRPKHAIYITWQLVNRYGHDAMFLLGKEMSTRGEMINLMMSNQQNLSSEGAMKLASKLYWDPETRTLKRDAVSRIAAGSLPRYIRWLDQLRLTYDLFSITVEELEELLPEEFNQFRSRRDRFNPWRFWPWAGKDQRSMSS